MESGVSAATIILGLVGFLQVIFMFTVGRLFSTQDKIFKLIETNRKSCVEKIEKIEKDYRDEIKTLKRDNTTLLDNHYVTNGQLNTLEKELKGEIKNLTTSIEHLTAAINRTFKDNQ